LYHILITNISIGDPNHLLLDAFPVKFGRLENSVNHTTILRLKESVTMADRGPYLSAPIRTTVFQNNRVVCMSELIQTARDGGLVPGLMPPFSFFTVDNSV
jgi:hypothetical protein